MDEPLPESPEKPSRLEHLGLKSRRIRVGKSYSRFVHSMRILLPVFALGLVAIVMAWPDMEDAIEPLRKEELMPESIMVKNELLTPRYESTDSGGQPFTVTAAKAIQGIDNPNLVNLERPMADMMLKDGAWVAAEAAQGIYDQQGEKLTLSGSVKLFHDRGYQMETEDLRVDIKTRQAWSAMPVTAQGPEGRLVAEGLEADANAGTMVFTGPAKLTLEKANPVFTGRGKDKAP